MADRKIPDSLVRGVGETGGSRGYDLGLGRYNQRWEFDVTPVAQRGVDRHSAVSKTLTISRAAMRIRLCRCRCLCASGNQEIFLRLADILANPALF